MSDQESFSNIIKCGTTTFHSNIFAWDVYPDDSTRYTSSIFKFCGYSCYLSYVSTIRPLYEAEYATVVLHGYQAPYKKRISCHYSIFLKNNVITSKSKSGQIQTTEGYIRIDLCDEPITQSEGLTICFSWCEDDESGVSSQGVQTEPGRVTSVIERWTQTEDIQISPMRDNQTDTGQESYTFLEILSKDLGSFYKGQTDHDCVLKVGETEFPVHRSVLTARSPVFAAMFHHDTTESREGTVEIPDVDATALGEVLYYIYTGTVRGLSPDTATLMYNVADKYSLIDFTKKCVDFLTHNLTMKNVCDAAVLSHKHNEEELEKAVIQFIKVRLQDLMITEKWRHFSTAHSLLANKLLCSALIASQTGKM